MSYKKYKSIANQLIISRLTYFNKSLNYQINKVKIKNQKTLWGSCSKKGNLNFNYKIIFLPIDLSDYIIVHELCHLGEFNHSKRFWKLLSLTLPDYAELRNKLRKVNLRKIKELQPHQGTDLL